MKLASAKKHLGVSKVKNTLPAILRSGETVTILKSGVPVYVLLPMDRLESLLETLEVMGNPAAMKAIRNHQAGKTKFIPWRKVEKELDAMEALEKRS